MSTTTWSLDNLMGVESSRSPFLGVRSSVEKKLYSKREAFLVLAYWKSYDMMRGVTGHERCEQRFFVNVRANVDR